MGKGVQEEPLRNEWHYSHGDLNMFLGQGVGAGIGETTDRCEGKWGGECPARGAMWQGERGKGGAV